MGWQHVPSPVGSCGCAGGVGEHAFCSLHGSAPRAIPQAVPQQQCEGPSSAAKSQGTLQFSPFKRELLSLAGQSGCSDGAMWKKAPVPLAVLAALCTEKQARQTVSIPLSSGILVFRPKWAMWNLSLCMVSGQWIASCLCDHPTTGCYVVVLLFL